MTTTLVAPATAAPAAADPRYWDCPELDSEQHITASLGQPIDLPDYLAEALATDWATEHDEELADHFAMLTGGRYEQFHRDNTYNVESDLSQFYVWSVWAPADCSDWYWANDVFVVVEMGSPGDPRCCGYGPAQIYRVDNLAESGFLDTVVGWFAQPISDHYSDNDPELQTANEWLSIGYSSNPTCQLRSMLAKGCEPKWSDRHGCYVARLRDLDFPVMLLTVAPYYC